MPAPFSPNPADPASGSHPEAERVSNTPVDNHADSTPFALPFPEQDDPPTVISSARLKPGGFDGEVGSSLAGRKLGHFELIEAVGAGGMAAVLKARDLDLGRVVALKILPPDMAADPENIVRFKHEARAAARLDHDNIARVYYFGEDQGLHFIAFEFVDGDNLRQLMEANGGTIPVPEAVAIMLQISAGLSHAAERHVVHRDIKPSNIIVTPDGRAKIVDMGLARSMDVRHAGQLTESGITLGTFDYISPEQAIEPRLADVRSDIYSLGCTFYHALTGHSPVPDGTAAKKLDAQKNQVPIDPRKHNRDIPVDLSAILSRMMAKDPDRRYQHPDHLSAHLRALARKMGVPIGTLSSLGSAQDRALAAPRRMSAAWLITAAAVITLALGIFTDGFRRAPRSSQVGPTAGHVPNEPIDSSTPAVGPGPVATGVREAATTDELLNHLKQGARHIRLTGKEYDLTRSRDNQPIEALLVGEEVRIESLIDSIVRIGCAADGPARPKSLTLRGPGGGKGIATVRGIRFIIPGAIGDDDDAGVLVSGFERTVIEDCTFATSYRTSRAGPAALGLVLRGGTVRIENCYFSQGCVGVLIDGPGRVAFAECAIGPQFAGVKIVRSEPDESADETELTFRHCSALLPKTGALVEVGESVPCVVRAGHCLFGGPDRYGPDEIPVVLRQLVDRARATRYEAESESASNFYHNMAAYFEREEAYTFAEAAREKLPVRDTERVIKHPWEDKDPFKLLADRPPDPQRAFRQNLQLVDLRGKDDPNRQIAGTRYLAKEPLYTLPLPSPSIETRDATVKIWDPSLPDTNDVHPPGVFPTLAKALAALKRGDNTILIRHTGRLEVEPCEFTKADTNLTLKPDAGYKPVLVPALSMLKRATGIFKLYGGRLILDGLHFRLPVDRVPAVAVLPGGGQFELRNSVVTLDDGEDLSAVSLTNPRTEMMMPGSTKPENWPVPKIVVDNVFVRGKGQLLNVKSSRPFDLEVKNSIAALDAPMIEIDPSATDPSAAGSGLIKLTRVTAYLGSSLLHIRAAEKKSDAGTAGLARTEVLATGCLFAPAGGSAEPLVRMERIDVPELLAEKWLLWSGRNSLYGHDKKKTMLEIRPTDVAAMSIKTIEGDKWLEMTMEDNEPFAGIAFEYRLPDAGQTRKFLTVHPSDFGMVRFDPPREGAAEIGAPAGVPVPFGDE